MGLRCRFPSLAKGSQCERCGYTLSRSHNKEFARQCLGVDAASKEDASRRRLNPCAHLGPMTGETAVSVCKGKRVLRGIYQCHVHGRCVPLKAIHGIACCEDCEDYSL